MAFLRMGGTLLFTYKIIYFSNFLIKIQKIVLKFKILKPYLLTIIPILTQYWKENI